MIKPKHLFCIYENATKDTGKDSPKFLTKFFRFDQNTELFYNGKLYNISAGKGQKLLVKRRFKVYSNNPPVEVKHLDK
ncbi:hypothetical protein NVP1187O_016 [Vibrio phage 1.187.O._10N.286.49.F1]|nr:hypothetical protein NVP1187O_016 [Vibrio phage 1.187.O._10N.286.49.F1]